MVYSFVPSFRAKRAAKEAKEAQALPAPVRISSPGQLDSFPVFSYRMGMGMKSVNMTKFSNTQDLVSEMLVIIVPLTSLLRILKYTKENGKQPPCWITTRW